MAPSRDSWMQLQPTVAKLIQFSIHNKKQSTKCRLFVMGSANSLSSLTHHLLFYCLSQLGVSVRSSSIAIWSHHTRNASFVRDNQVARESIIYSHVQHGHRSYIIRPVSARVIQRFQSRNTRDSNSLLWSCGRRYVSRNLNSDRFFIFLWLLF